MKTYKVTGIKWDCDECDPQEFDLPTDTTIQADDEDEVVDALSDKYGFCIESVEDIAESADPKEGVEMKCHELLERVMEMSKDKIGRALNCGALNIEPNDGLDYRVAKIIVHAIMKAMVDETCPLYRADRKESENLYIFL